MTDFTLENAEESQSNVAVEFVRDSTFSRAIIDRMFVLDLGRDVELACVQLGPELVRLHDMGSQEKLDLSPKMTEVVRLRMEWRDAVASAMHILERGIATERVNATAVISAISSISPESGESGQSGGEASGG